MLDAFRNTGGSKVDACLMEAKARVQLGDKSSAMAAFRQALAEDQTCVDACYGLLNTDARSVDGADAAFLENTWHSLGALRDKVLAGFALAHWHEVRANFNEQLHWLDLTNEARRALRPFDRGTLNGWHDLTRRFCTFEWYSRLVLPDALPESVAPILICGMPRSGTTLIEQTLAACESVT
ncbi:MAG: hypothetical protein CL544_15395 [Alcanivorax sp.]|nr:hypothetical protein [Alcanivorax sp.]